MKPFADGCIANLMDRLDAREDILEKQDDSVQEGDLSGRQLSTPRQSWRDVQTDVRDELVGRSNEAERVTSEGGPWIPSDLEPKMADPYTCIYVLEKAMPWSPTKLSGPTIELRNARTHNTPN